MIKIYGRTNSANVQLVMWAMAEMGVASERFDYGAGHASPRSAEFLAKNPMGLVPVLEDGDLVMFESAAIMRYLCAVHGTDPFWPSDLRERGRLDTWAEWGKNTFTPAVLRIFVYDVRTAPDDRNPSELQAASKVLADLAGILDRRLDGRDWIGGGDFTFADVACGTILYRYHELPWDKPNLANVSAYYDRLQQRPAFREHVMISYEALRGNYPMKAK